LLARKGLTRKAAFPQRVHPFGSPRGRVQDRQRDGSGVLTAAILSALRPSIGSNRPAGTGRRGCGKRVRAISNVEEQW